MSADSDYHRYVFFVQWISGLDTSQMVYGHVDGNEIWYIRGEKQTLNAREAGYTDADNEVVIYLDQNDNCEKIISREKMGVTADNRYSRIFNSVEYWNRFLDSCYSIL